MHVVRGPTDGICIGGSHNLEPPLRAPHPVTALLLAAVTLFTSCTALNQPRASEAKLGSKFWGAGTELNTPTTRGG